MKPQSAWEQYVSSWNETDVVKQRRMLLECAEENCRYRDPLAQTSGPDELVGYIAEFHRQAPGAIFKTQHFQYHNERSIAEWHMLDVSGVALSKGTSFGEYSASGKLVAMTGFFEVPPAT